MNETEQLMRDFPINTPVKGRDDLNFVANRYGNVVGYALNLFDEPVLVIKWFYSIENLASVEENISAINPNNLVKL